MKTEISTSVIIPNYNGINLLKKNLPQVIKAFGYSKNKVSEIILVDDSSTDESVVFVKRNFPKVKVIKHKVNRGFSAAVNTGARAATGEILVLLNTDVYPSENFLEYAVFNFRDNKVFAVSLHEEGFGWAKGFFKDGFLNHLPGPESNSTHETFWVNGGSGLFRRSYWMKLGGMDERLLSPFYWEDVDISYRAAKRGWKLLWEPKAKVLHEHEGTIKKISQKYKLRVQERNQLIVIWKNITSPLLFRKHIFSLFKRVISHPGYMLIVCLAFLKIRGILKARSKEVKEGKVSDEAIFAKFNYD